jgi:hypothetical protein
VKGIDIIVCLVVAVLCIVIIRYLIRQKKAGHKSCGFDCSSCSMCSHENGHCHK